MAMVERVVLMNGVICYGNIGQTAFIVQMCACQYVVIKVDVGHLRL